MRQVSSRPDKILDAPDLLDDFYLHLLDWSINNHLVSMLIYRQSPLINIWSSTKVQMGSKYYSGDLNKELESKGNN